MNSFIQDFFKRLTSRKFIIVLGGAVGCYLYPSASDTIVQLVGIYCAAEGLPDFASRIRATSDSLKKPAADVKQVLKDAAETIALANGDDDDIDRSKIVAGGR